MEKITVLTSMAFLFDNNPIDIFTKFTHYCISKHSAGDVVDILEIKKAFSQFFGFPIPVAILSTCLKKLKREDIIQFTDKNECKVLDPAVDFSDLNKKIEQYQNQEKMLVNGFCDFARSKYNISLEETEAESLIDDFLTKEGCASKLFFDNNTSFGINIEESSKRLIIPKTYYLAKYFDFLMNQECPEKNYLESVITGIIAYIGVNSIGENTIQSNFKGTKFFFDTKLVLRLLGISFNYSKEAAHELLNEIKNNKGIPAIFEHTLNEVVNAFDNAIGRIKRHILIEDSEFAFYCETINNEANILTIRRENVRNSIIGMGFQVIPDEKLEEKIRWCLPWKDAIDFITQAQPNWKNQSIENDIKSLNNIHILRQGKYSKRFGGSDKLPVFITTNTALIKTMKEMVVSSEKYELEKTNFPFISDVELMSILWFPRRNTDLPKLTLARNIHAICDDTYAFRRKIKENGAKIDSLLSNDLTVDSVKGLWTSKVMDQYIVKSNTDKETQEDDALIVASIDEVIKIQSLNDRNKLQEKDQKIEELNKLLGDSINSFSIFAEKIATGFRLSFRLRAFIFFLKNLSLLISIIISIVEFILLTYLIPHLDIEIRIAVSSITICVGVIIRSVVGNKRVWGKKEKLKELISKEISLHIDDSMPNAEEIRELCFVRLMKSLKTDD